MPFAEVILHRRVPSRFSSFTYEIPKGLALAPGQLVRIPFRKQKLSGVVRSLHENTPRYPTKCIEAALPLVLAPWQMELANWMSEKYQAPLAKVIDLFLPEHIWAGKLKKKFKIKNAKDEKGQELLLFPELFSLQKCATGLPIFHGALKESEKAQIWNDVKEGKISAIAGTRLALFLPFQKLSAITLHFEENENYREQRQPNYHAFEVAERLAQIWEIPLTIVSASPRVETWWKCHGESQKSKIKCQMWDEKKKKAEVKIIDMREERKKGNYGIFAESVLEKIASALTQNFQVLLFINRRGSASALLCQECHTVFRCGKCSSPLTLHGNNELRCHRCRIAKPVPTQCPLCHSLRLKPLGTGTEGLEKEMKKIFGKAKVMRLDREKVAPSLRLGLDEKTLAAADIIVATQIIDKPLDLPRLKLAVVPAADPLFSYPDFRAQEKAFQLFTHLRHLAAGGELILQTYLPEHPLFQYLQKNLTEKFYEDELATRKSLSLPPFGAS
jgi:primosomal protein N' (replication factor Y)